jgi:hypothetical protein
MRSRGAASGRMSSGAKLVTVVVVTVVLVTTVVGCCMAIGQLGVLVNLPGTPPLLR